MAERLVGNVDSVASAGYLIPTSRGDARSIADRTPYGESAEADVRGFHVWESLRSA